MQPTPSSSLRSDHVRPYRVWTTTFHAAMFLGLLTLGACRDPKVSAYRVPKEPAGDQAKAAPHGATGSVADAAKPAMPPMSAAVGAPGSAAPAPDTHGLQTASGPGLSWTAPVSWQPKQGSMMRKATFAIVGEGGAAADLAVTAFPGDVGGDIANVNRWRGQLGLPEVSDAQATAAIERIEVNGLKIGVVDIVDLSATNHLLGAMVPYEGATWFFKLVGPDAIVAKQKAAYLEFIKTIKPAAVATP